MARWPGVSIPPDYWYDGARNGIPTADHRRIGGLSYVKMRLGRLNRRNQQKGVDGLIYRDLTALARTGAVARAYLFTGDEDLRESVVTAQDMGVQVIVMSFAPTPKTGRSAELVQDADEVMVLSERFWTSHFAPRGPARARIEPPADEEIKAVAADFAGQWGKDATVAELLALLAQAPTIPKDLYVQLLQHAEGTLGSLRPFGAAKGQLRAYFFADLERQREDSTGARAPDAAA